MGRGTLAGIALLALLGADASAAGPVTHPTLDAEPAPTTSQKPARTQHPAATKHAARTASAAPKHAAGTASGAPKPAGAKASAKRRELATAKNGHVAAAKPGRIAAAKTGHIQTGVAGKRAHVASTKRAQVAATKRGKRVVAKRVGRAMRAAGRSVVENTGLKPVNGPYPAVATTSKPLVVVAKLQADGRVRYGADHLPPGYAWPPTPAMVAASRACEAQLDALGIVWKAADPEGMIADPIVVPAMEIGGVRYTSAFRRKTPPAMDCQFVRALAAVGPELRALGVAEVQFGSVYRNTLARSHGQTKDFLSRHALGIAMDVKAFVDDTGRVAKVETDYLKDDPLLHGIEDLINKRTDFRDVLSPANDPISHDDHFHIEASVDFTAFR